MSTTGVEETHHGLLAARRGFPIHAFDRVAWLVRPGTRRARAVFVQQRTTKSNSVWRLVGQAKPGQRARRGLRALKQTSSRAAAASGAGAAGGATAAPNDGGGDGKAIVPPPPQRAKRGPAEGDARLSDAQIAEYYDVVTAGGGATARRRLSGKADAEHEGRV